MKKYETHMKIIMISKLSFKSPGGSETYACRQMSSSTTCNYVVNDIVLDKDDVVHDMDGFLPHRHRCRLISMSMSSSMRTEPLHVVHDIVLGRDDVVDDMDLYRHGPT